MLQKGKFAALEQEKMAFAGGVMDWMVSVSMICIFCVVRADRKDIQQLTGNADDKSSVFIGHFGDIILPEFKLIDRSLRDVSRRGLAFVHRPKNIRFCEPVQLILVGAFQL